MSKPKLQLTGEDGNAFFILAKAKRTLIANGYPKEEIDRFISEAMSGDYNHLLQICMNWFEVD